MEGRIKNELADTLFATSYRRWFPSRA